MEFIEQTDLNKLLERTQDKTCISLFIPTQRAGKEVLEKEDKTRLKSIWKEAKAKLNENCSSGFISKMNSHIESLLDDVEFWRHQSDGLAIYLSEDFFKTFSLPIQFETYYYIGNEFYIKPLAPTLSSGNQFYLLSFQIEEVKLFEATEHTFQEIEVEDLLPSRLEERVGYDYKERALQFRTQQGGNKAMFHGHGGNERDDKEEIKLFFSAVNKGITNYLGNKNDLLVVACQDYLFSIYKEVNTYANLYEKPVPGNPSEGNKLDLHKKTVKFLAGSDYLNKEKQKLEEFKEVVPEKKSVMIHDIIPAAFEGKIDTLFIENRAELKGLYNEETREVKLENEGNNKLSLLNLAAIKVIENGGSVYLTETAFMPEKGSKLNAIYRY